MKPIDIHPGFSLNGSTFNKNELKEFAYDYIKEGEPFEREIGLFLSDWTSQNEFIKVNTSGSTGEPKSILLKKEHMINSAIATGRYFNLVSGNSAVHCLPSNFIAGKMMLVRAMVLGLRLECVPPVSKPLLDSKIAYDFAAMVPLQLENSINQIDTIKQLIVGGAPISRSLKERIQHKKTKIFETYGMTETITHIAVRQVNFKKDLPFKTLPNIVIKTDSRDCLVIDAPNITESTVVTNDIVNLISETEFEWVGRYDNIINSGGVKLIPEKIETLLAPLLKNRYFIAGIPDELLGQKIVLVIEGEVDQGRLWDGIRSVNGFTKYQIPKEVLISSGFSVTKNGKIDRTETLKSLFN